MLLIPYAFVRNYDALDPNAPGGPAFNQETENEFGLDAKFVFNDSLVLDATLNPDFSQVESDEPRAARRIRVQRIVVAHESVRNQQHISTRRHSPNTGQTGSLIEPSL